MQKTSLRTESPRRPLKPPFIGALPPLLILNFIGNAYVGSMSKRDPLTTLGNGIQISRCFEIPNAQCSFTITAKVCRKCHRMPLRP